MKILITPRIREHSFDASLYLTKNLADLFQQRNHFVGISTDLDTVFRNYALFEAGTPKKPRFYRTMDNKSYEEYLYSSGFLTKEYLEEDFEILIKTIRDFSPDLIITMDRIAAIPAAKSFSVPCWVIVNGEMFMNNPFPNKCMLAINELLKTHHFTQVFRLNELFALCDKRITFGHALTQPIETADIYRFGSESILSQKTRRNNRICIFLDQLRPKLMKIIQNEFMNTPYSVYFSYPGCEQRTVNNIKFTHMPKIEYIPGCTACIHAGNDYFFNQAMAAGVPQLIVSNRTYLRSFLASAAKRNHFGTFIYEEDMNKETFHSAFRELIENDIYYEEARFMKKQISKLGDLSEILDLLK